MNSNSQKVCYKTVGCSDYGYLSAISAGYYGTKHTIRTDGTLLTCYKNVGQCTYFCPKDYYTAPTSSGYLLTTTSTYQTRVQTSTLYTYNCSTTNTTRCYTQRAKTCADINSSYVSSLSSGYYGIRYGPFTLGTNTNAYCYTQAKCKYQCSSSYYYPWSHADVERKNIPDGYKQGSNESTAELKSYTYHNCSDEHDSENCVNAVAKTCSDYNSAYKSSLSSGYYGYSYTLKLGASNGTCYKNVGQCTYSCPSSYYTAASDGYKLISTSKYQTRNQTSTSYVYSSSNCGTTNSTKCYTQTAKTCADYSLVASCPSGQSGTAVTKKLGANNGTCYKDCKVNKTVALEGYITAKDHTHSDELGIFIRIPGDDQGADFCNAVGTFNVSAYATYTAPSGSKTTSTKTFNLCGDGDDAGSKIGSFYYTILYSGEGNCEASYSTTADICTCKKKLVDSVTIYVTPTTSNGTISKTTITRSPSYCN